MDVDAWRSTHGFWHGLLHCIFLLPAASVHNLVPEFMHIVDIGLALHASGNTIFELVFERTRTKAPLAAESPAVDDPFSIWYW